MSGVLSKIFTASHYTKTSAAGYSALIAFCTAVISSIMLIPYFRKRDNTPKIDLFNTFISAMGGITNKIANFLLVVALAHVDASVQYPMVTGGVMIVSTAICFFDKIKPTKKEILSVIIAFIGMLALFVIPI